jgi:TolA-binding protein/thiol-disulfide isomerase/thioredoxin
MGMARWSKSLLLGMGFVCSATLIHAQTPPEAVAQILRWQPAQKGTVVAMPTAAEAAKCTVSGDATAKQGQSVWLLKDEKGTTLRRFIDTNSDKYPDIFSYYKDGIEVYREVDSKFTGKPDRFQWLNTGGAKIGVSKAGNGTIDTWVALSVEELSQEVMKAVVYKDSNRYTALLINEADFSTLGITATEADRIKTGLKNVPSQFAQVAAKFNLNEGTKWLHVETEAPSRLLAETTGWKQDVILYGRAMILCETNGKTEYIQLGDVIQVGDVWKLKDAPTTLDTANTTSLIAGNTPASSTASAAPGVENPAMQKALKALADLDAKAPQDATNGPSPAMVQYHSQRAEVINQIVAACTEKDREAWYKQLIDSLSASVAASPANDTQALRNFQSYAAKVAQQAPGSEVASYAQYRLLNIENNRKTATLSKVEDHQKALAEYAEKLTGFVNAYPQGSDTPEVLYRLGEIHEQLVKEAEARKWYELLVSKYGSSKVAQKGAGAVRRLTSIGQTWSIGTNVQVLNGNNPFNPQALQNRTVVVYYWATWCDQAANDYAKLKQVLTQFSAKGVVLVAVNIDDKLPDAQAFFQKHASALPPALHLHSPGGYDSPAVAHYGINIFPAMFLMDASGKITSRTLDVATLEEELKKIVK